MGYGFNQKDAGRIAHVVRRVEKSTLGADSHRRRHKGGGGGSDTFWAKVTTVTDNNNYTVSVWLSRSSYENADDALETDKECLVPEINNELDIDDTFPVEASTVEDIDYIAIQQMGIL